jgi:S-adenosylmethionine:tRNA ribosyltransferase-isomerase
VIPASVATQRRLDGKLLVVDERGTIDHRTRASFPALVQPGDVVVANDAATLPASLAGLHVPTGAVVEVRLTGRGSLLGEDVTRFTAVIFGAGDFRTPTEARPSPPALQAGDELLLGPLRAVVGAILGHPRLIELCFLNPIAEIWEALARHGRPIQYAYVLEPLAIWDTWTRIANLPVAFEPPSAGFILDWAMVDALRARGASFATLTHAAGISSTGDPDLDSLLPLDEPYHIPAPTAALIAAACAARKPEGFRLPAGRTRVIAIGTTVVRALEDAANMNGSVRPGPGVATQRIGPFTRLRVVDAILSGTHEPGTSHYDLLRAFQADDVLRRMERETEAHAYRTHEFGDSVFVAGPWPRGCTTPRDDGEAWRAAPARGPLGRARHQLFAVFRSR